MEAISIFDIFKIGVGPSSSHTLGPWRAALLFIEGIESLQFDRINIHLFGSLSKTGIGHATDKAIILGLLGHSPKSFNTNLIDSVIEKVNQEKEIKIHLNSVQFDPKNDIVFEQEEHSSHPNTLIFKLYQKDQLVHSELFNSVGGGFIESDSRNKLGKTKTELPYPIKTGGDILKYTNEHQCRISDIVYKNELSLRSENEINQKTKAIFDVLLKTIYDGCRTEGVLPGGLFVTRRAKQICDSLINHQTYNSIEEWIELIHTTSKDFNSVNKWISCFALAANEQNAAMGRIVTSPTNGAAGVIPSVMMYYRFFCKSNEKKNLDRFLFTAGEIGCLFKKGATISAAMGGCQAEIGVSSAMAAGALTEALGGTPEQSLMAAEIAMEHHLGLTCDPVKGLVQVPCIERNAMGAIKAITATNLALESDPKKAIVNIDTVIKTMWDVAQDMNSKYKETSDGGLAINLPVINPNC